jgi:iron complex outermembrane receptor protein
MILLRLFAGLLCVWLLVCSRVAHAQTKAPPDSTHIIATQNVPKTLKSIEIIEYKQHRTAQGATVIVIDSLWRNSGTIDGVLGTFANQFVRNYGVGTLALAAVRGTNAAQTAVLWQGVNLQSAMNGVADLALMPAYLFDNAKVVLGGGGSLYGSGAVGGTVLLHNNFAFVDTRFSAQIKPQMGSFGQRSLGTRLQYHHPKFYIDAKSYTSTAKNDFEYQTLELGLPTRTLTNAAAQQQAYTLSAGFRPNSYHFVELHTWQQRTHRQIPPTLTTATSRSHQADSTTRTAIVWQYSRRRTHTKTQVAHATETIFFADSNINLYAHNQAKTTLAETNITQNYKKISTLIGAQYTHIQAQAQAYQARQMQYQTAFFGQIDIKTSEKTNVSTAARHQNTRLIQ